MIRVLVIAAVVAYLPGAVLFRLPVLDRDRRAALSAEERVFWHLVISLAWSLAVVLALAAFGAYRLDRLVIADVAIAAAAVAGWRGRLRYAGTAAGPTRTALLPVLLVLLGIARFFPASEYVIGGKDPGGYVNQGVLLATHGSLVLHEPDVAALKPPIRSLFFNSHNRAERDYFDNRFMGFFLQDPETGLVVGQFPHLYPASAAIAYDLIGIKGALGVVGLWAILGVLAVYLAGARFLGRTAAFAACVLLSLNIIEVWYARYPNAEVVMQALLFAAILAFARAHQDGDRFFAPVAGTLCALLVFHHITALLAIAAIGAAAGLAWVVDGKRPRLGFVVPLAAGLALGWFYWTGPMRASFARTVIYLQNLPALQVAAGVAAAGIALLLAVRLRRTQGNRARALIPIVLAGLLVVLAVYAWGFRVQGGKLADFDAATLRTFISVYLYPLGMIATLTGLVLVLPRRFWRDPALVMVAAAFALFLFFKLQVVPEHIWLARRFLPVILPSAVLFAAAAALGTGEGRPRGWQILRVGIGAIALVILGQQYRLAAAPVMPHVEFRGLIEHVAQLAGRFTDRDLVLVESRSASDVHVLAIPTAYIHGRHVLVLETEKPDKALLSRFLDTAMQTYERVFFLGGGGTDLLSPELVATPVAQVNRQMPSFVVSPWNAYRAGIRQYKFDYSLYRLERGESRADGFALDIGFEDDLQVVRFGGKELTEGRTFRWTDDLSYVAVRGLTGREHEVALVVSDGGRPGQVGPARVEVFLNETRLGQIDVGTRISGVHAAGRVRGHGARARGGRRRGAAAGLHRVAAEPGARRQRRHAHARRHGGSSRDTLTGMPRLQIYHPRERALVALADASIAPLGWLRAAAADAGPIRRVLILRLERIGDLLMVLGALRDARQAWPDAEIDLAVGSWNESLARLIPGVSHVQIADAPWLARETGAAWRPLLAGARTWRARRYDLVVNLEPDIRSNLLAWLTGARRRVGYWTGGGGAFLTDAARVRADVPRL